MHTHTTEKKILAELLSKKYERGWTRKIASKRTRA